MVPAGHDPNFISALLWQENGKTLRWPANSPIRISYSFYEPAQSAMVLGGYGQAAALTAAQRTGFEAALATWEAVTNVDFIPTASDRASLRIAYGELPANWLAVAHVQFTGNGSLTRAEIWFNDRYAYMADLRPGTFAFFVAIHEIGHALGLGHPFEGANRLSTDFDHAGYTVMSYTRHPGVGKDATGLPLAPATPMLYDIAAVQYLYGPNRQHARGDDVYRFEDGLAPVRTLWDSGGIDTIDARSQLLPVKIDLREGAASSIGRRGVGKDWGQPAQDNVRIAFGTIIENAMGGAGDDVLIGNHVANVLEGGGGNDILYGGGGADIFVFGDSFGHDVIKDAEPRDHLLFLELDISSLRFARSGSALVIKSAHGRVTIEQFYEMVQSITINGRPYGLNGWTFADREERGSSSGQGLTLFGGPGHDRILGSEADDHIEGGAGDDRIFGLNGNDTLFGGPGQDRLEGGLGNDALSGGEGRDRLNGGDGNDRLEAGADDDRLMGGDGDDCLDGGEGNDGLAGGNGDDILIGGPGNDTLLGGLGIDVAVFAGNFADFSLRLRRGAYLITDLNPADGDLGGDRLSGIEYLQFDDALVDLTGKQPMVVAGGVPFIAFAAQLEPLLHPA